MQANSPLNNRYSAAGLGATYGFRLFRNVELEAGTFAAIDPFPPECNRSGCFSGDNRFFWIPFGVRFVLPLRRNRVELSSGGGGLYQKFSVKNPNLALGQQPYTAWGGYFVASGRIALERGRHFWLGATARFFLANGAGVNTRWLMVTGDISFRF